MCVWSCKRGGRHADTEQVKVTAGGGGIAMANLLKDSGLNASTSESLRMIAQGGVKIDGEKVGDKALRLAAGVQVVVQVGKRKFAKITLA